MKDDLLSESVKALRDSGEAEDGGTKFTRARIMASLHKERVRRRTRLAFLLPIAATFVAASAFGVVTSEGRAFFARVGESLGIGATAPAPSPASASPKASKSKGTARDTEAPPHAPPIAAPSPEPSVTPAPALVPATPAASGSNAPSDAELELYRTAHRAHFAENDPARALLAWDAYLAQSPRGHFVLEAKYNRALCLVRLDRKADARRALEPFARGNFGNYRQREASELLSALGN